MLHWYIAETLPPEEEASLVPVVSANSEVGGQSASERPKFAESPLFPSDTTIAARIALEADDYQPRHYEGTGVDEEEACYQAQLVDVNKAVDLLPGSMMPDVVRQGWRMICLRATMEEKAAS
jgi:hypothetical protein